MSIPSTFAPIYPQDFNLTPIEVYKSYSISGSEFETTSSGYSLLEGYFTTRKTPIGTDEALNDPINSLDGSYKHIIWKHIDHMYYRYPYDYYRSAEHSNKRYSYKFLNLTASLISIPYMDYGESLRKESVRIINSDLGITLKDDGYGNLYDIDVEDSLFSSSYRSNLIGYFGFNELYRNFKFGHGFSEYLESKYQSSQFSLSETYKLKNINIVPGIEINNTGSGLAVEFDGSGGYVQIHNRKEFDFDSLDQFTISFWVYLSGNTSGSLITKRGVVYKDVLGYEDKVLSTTGQIVKGRYISSSFVDQYTDVYPYDISISGSTLYYKRSDGFHSISISGSLTTGSWNHVSALRHNDYCALFINNQFKQQIYDSTSNPLNGYDILFGAVNQSGDNSITCKLDEVRFYNSSFISGSNISGSTFHIDLYNTDYIYNTAIVGNVFYRTGNIVISSLNPIYNNMLSGTNWVLNYDWTHTIYEYSILSRIRKGDFNLTMNPSARRSPKSDQLISDFTGSLLKPYATTIGFYNDKGELLVVAKLGQALQMREDVDINILTKFDG